MSVRYMTLWTSFTGGGGATPESRRPRWGERGLPKRGDWGVAQRSVQDMQGSMLLTIIGISEIRAPDIITWRTSQFM